MVVLKLDELKKIRSEIIGLREFSRSSGMDLSSLQSIESGSSVTTKNLIKYISYLEFLWGEKIVLNLTPSTDFVYGD